MYKRVNQSGGEFVIKKPAPANRSHLMRPKLKQVVNEEVASPVVPKGEAVKKPPKEEPPKPELQSDQEGHSSADDTPTRSGRSCKNKTKAWASLMPAKRGKPEDENEEEAEDANTPLPSPPKTFPGLQNSKRGRRSIPLSNSTNATPLKRPSESVESTPKAKAQKAQERQEAMRSKESLPEDPASVPKKALTSSRRSGGGLRARTGRASVGVPRNGQAVNLSSPADSSPQKSAEEVPEPVKQPRKRLQPSESQQTPQIQNPPKTPRLAQVQEAPKEEAPNHEKTIADLNKVITTLKDQCKRLAERRTATIEHLEATHKTVVEAKDRRIAELEADLEQMENTLQNAISDQVEQINGSKV
ncbi:hypothetical protein L596_019984 [Steinernema carpocapsae]|uniref:Uncharacterized protein n=1 Tax=Steinernema carpocapsae TaxID=34508 RepID=A0A4U5MS69_STECR|nr:hypothetical protein L596_019984 [Steinernema carpocapsae]